MNSNGVSNTMMGPLDGHQSAIAATSGNRSTLNNDNINNLINENVNSGGDGGDNLPLASVSSNVPFEAGGVPPNGVGTIMGRDTIDSELVGQQQQQPQQEQHQVAACRVKASAKQMQMIIEPDGSGVGYTTRISHVNVPAKVATSVDNNGNCQPATSSATVSLASSQNSFNNFDSIIKEPNESLLLNAEDLELQLNTNKRDSNNKNNDQSSGKVVIKIDRCQSVVVTDIEEDNANDGKEFDDQILKLLDDDNSQADLLQPTFPHSLAPSSSALDISQIDKMSTISKLANLTSGSLSDTSFVRPSGRVEAHLARRQMEERLRNWKRSNKIITHITENPFNMHLDCLERLGHVETGVGEAHSFEVNANAIVKFALHTDTDDEMRQKRLEDQAERQLKLIQVNNQQTDQRQESGDNYKLNNSDQQQQQTDQQQVEPKSQQHLQHLESHLSTIYKKNQAVMDSNSDFRTLLYNIICCLLIQDDQVLATPSVTKMIDVIRAHLESAAKSYATAMSAVQNAMPESQRNQINRQVMSSSASVGQSSSSRSTLTDNRKCSVAGSSCGPESLGGGSGGTMPPASSVMLSGNSIDSSNQSVITDQSTTSSTTTVQSNSTNYLAPERSQKPADFRRISSVSYNDEQLIHDLCDMQQPCGDTPNGSSPSGSRQVARCPDSPWRFEELWSECKHHGNANAATGSADHHTSQSSLENNSALDMMNDSGVGTMIESQAATDDQSRSTARSIMRNHRKRHSDVGEFRPMQQPSYISTDDYLSHNQQQQYDDSNRTSYYDDESNSMLQRPDYNELKTVDVASRRAELEWTLNKLINFELKYTWLTSQDTLRRAIRKIGVPNEIRGKVWLILIDQMIGNKYDAKKILQEATKTIELDEKGELNDEETQSILKQIELDVNRTMPGHKLFDDGAEGGVKLKRILVGYSIHINRAIAYCQGFNFIVALLLSVFDGDEEHALRGFVCIVDHIFPSKFYFDHYLTGARADQFLLADFICDQLIKSPTTAERKMVEGVTSSVTLNWFISLFHGAVPTLTRLTILDHFMLEGVKALFRFTMAILYLAFQVTPPSSCEVFTTIRNTAKDMYDIKLLLSIVEQIKLPKDSYFAIRRSFYMVQSSFNSDQFYMQSLSNDSGRQLVSSKPLSLQQLPDTKPPSMSFITAASIVAHQSFGLGDPNAYQHLTNSISGAGGGGAFGPRVCTSADKSKVCVQNIGKLGRSHLKIMDVNVRSNEKSLMSPLRNCLVIGISNCGKHVIVARRSSKRNFKTFQEQDLTFHVHELCTEIFDGFYIESRHIALVITHLGEVYKIDTTKCFTDCQAGSTETLMLRESHSIADHEKVKLRLASIDILTNLLWIHVECDDTKQQLSMPCPLNPRDRRPSVVREASSRSKYRENNPFLADVEEAIAQRIEAQSRSRFQRKILIIDIMTFDIFSAFSLQPNFGDIINMRTSLLAFCQLANPMSNAFSSRIIQIGPTGRFEQLLSFSDVVDYMIDVSDSYKRRQEAQELTGGHNNIDNNNNQQQQVGGQDQDTRYSTIRKFLTSSISMNLDDGDHDSSNRSNNTNSPANQPATAGTLTRYYRSLMRSHSTAAESINSDNKMASIQESAKGSLQGNKATGNLNQNLRKKTPGNGVQVHPFKAVITSYLGQVEEYAHTNYVPVNMAFIFRNGKIALFEFTESYAIHTRESQLDRYDYSKVIDVKKSGTDFIITILTIYDKLIKVVI